MRWWIPLLAACGGGAAPTCKDVVHATGSDATLLVGYCEQDAWSVELRGCVGKAKTPGEVSACFPVPPLAELALEPSQATLDAIGSDPTGITAIAFVDRDADPELARYVDKLPLHVERYDRLRDHQLALTYGMVRDGLVIQRGERRQVVEVPPLGEAKQRLGFDGQVLAALLKVKREPRHAYLLTGHGELNDAASKPVRAGVRPRATTMLMKSLTELDLSPAPLALVGDVPADASVVLWLGPQLPLAPAQEQALLAYLARGGALLVALDPDFPVGLGALEPVLGVHFDPGHLTDDKAFLLLFHDQRDHRVLAAEYPGKRPASATGPLPLIDAGTLAVAPGTTASVQVLVASGANSFIDRNDNAVHDDDEPRRTYPVAISSTGPTFRAQVYADADLFADVQAGGRYLAFPFMYALPDAIHWLHRDEQIAVPIEPNQAQLAAVAAAQARRDHVDEVRRTAERALRAR